jgi:hypothetical protein
VARRRPRPLRPPAGDPRAAARLELRLVEAEVRVDLPEISKQMLFGFLRRGQAPWTVEILDRETGRVVGVEPCEGTESTARGLLHVMAADLERLDLGAYLRRWGRRPR